MVALTTLAEVKQFMGIATGVTASDDLLTLLINGISESAVDLLGYNPLTASYDKRFNGNGAALLHLPDRPVTAVSTLEIDGVAIAASAAFGSPGYVIERNAIYLRGYTFTEGLRNVRVAYTAGYTNVAALPAGMRLAIDETVALRYQQRSNLGVSSKSLAGESISFEKAELTKSARAALRAYARVVPI